MAGGKWGAAVGLGPVNENVMGSADITSVSCRSAGYCAAVGFTSTTTSHVDEMYAVDETRGAWERHRRYRNRPCEGSGWAS